MLEYIGIAATWSVSEKRTLMELLVQQGAQWSDMELLVQQGAQWSDPVFAELCVGDLLRVKQLYRANPEWYQKAPRDSGGYTPLHYAVSNNQLSTVEWLIEETGARNHVAWNGIRASFLAVVRDCPDILQLLLKKGGARGDDRHKNGATIFLIAAAYGRLQIAQWLLTSRHSKIEERDDSENSALLLAASQGRLETVRWLLEHGGSRIDEQNKEGNTALLVSAQRAQLPVVQYLLNEGGATLHERNKAGWSALLLAAQELFSLLYPELAEYYQALLNRKQQDILESLAHLYCNPMSLEEMSKFKDYRSSHVYQQYSLLARRQYASVNTYEDCQQSVSMALQELLDHIDCSTLQSQQIERLLEKTSQISDLEVLNLHGGHGRIMEPVFLVRLLTKLPNLKAMHFQQCKKVNMKLIRELLHDRPSLHIAFDECVHYDGNALKPPMITNQTRISLLKVRDAVGKERFSSYDLMTDGEVKYRTLQLLHAEVNTQVLHQCLLSLTEKDESFTPKIRQKMQMLLDHGANINGANTCLTAWQGDLPLHTALVIGNRSLISWLRECSADPSLKETRRNETPIERFRRVVLQPEELLAWLQGNHPEIIAAQVPVVSPAQQASVAAHLFVVSPMPLSLTPEAKNLEDPPEEKHPTFGGGSKGDVSPHSVIDDSGKKEKMKAPVINQSELLATQGTFAATSDAQHALNRVRDVRWPAEIAGSNNAASPP